MITEAHILSVPCPICKAPAGEHCIMDELMEMGHIFHRGHPHDDRLVAYQGGVASDGTAYMPGTVGKLELDGGPLPPSYAAVAMPKRLWLVAPAKVQHEHSHSDDLQALPDTQPAVLGSQASDHELHDQAADSA